MKWLDCLGIAGGVFAGAWVLAFWATDKFFWLHHFVYDVGSGRELSVNASNRATLADVGTFRSVAEVYHWELIALWAIAGGIMGALGGILAVSLLRFLKRSSD